MRTLKKIAFKLHIYVMWLLISAIFWAWIFNLVTDTVPAKKVTLFAEVSGLEDKALAVELETELPEGVRMVKVHPFSYVMFQESTLLNADLYLVRESQAAGYMDSFRPLPPGVEGSAYYSRDGVRYGVLAYDAATDSGAARAYVQYLAEGEEPEDYYLFFGVNSVHAGERDEAALAVARHFLGLE